MQEGVDYIGVGTGVLIVDSKGEKTLLLKRSNNSKNTRGFWSQPGGSLDWGETPRQAAEREIKEELGVEIEIIEDFGYMTAPIPEDKQHWIVINFLAKIKSGEPKIMEPDKHDALQWFSLSNLPEPLTEPTKESVRRFKNKK